MFLYPALEVPLFFFGNLVCLCYNLCNRLLRLQQRWKGKRNGLVASRCTGCGAFYGGNSSPKRRLTVTSIQILWASAQKCPNISESFDLGEICFHSYRAKGVHLYGINAQNNPNANLVLDAFRNIFLIFFEKADSWLLPNMPLEY